MVHWSLLCFFLLRWKETSAEYSCVCSYAVEQKVLAQPDPDGQPIGYLYEFDCKHLIDNPNDQALNLKLYSAIEFEHKLGYVEKSQQLSEQVCPGSPSDADTIPSSTTRGLTAGSEKQTTYPPTSQLPSQGTRISTNKNVITDSYSSTSIPKTSSVIHNETLTISVPLTTPFYISSSVNHTITNSTMLSTTGLKVPITPTKLPLVTRTVVDTTSSNLQYLGIGYNILYGNPDAIVASNNHTDPGFLPDQRIFQLTHIQGSAPDIAREVEYTYNSKCTSTTFLVHDGVDYQNKLKQYMYLGLAASDIKGDTDIQNSAFVYNKDFMNLTEELDTNTDVLYRDNVTSCNHVTVRYKTEVANASEFLISKAFAKDVCQLPPSFDVLKYLPFINKWGTHVVMETQNGIKSLSRYRLDGKAILKEIQNQNISLVYPTGSYKGYQTSISFNTTAFSKVSTMTSGSLVYSKKAGTTMSLVPTRITLAPLSTALEPAFWNSVLTKRDFMDICPDSIDKTFLRYIASNIDRALEQYTPYKQMISPQHTILPKGNDISIPLTWPDGTYTLMEAAIGCPGGHVAWKLGWRKYDTENTVPHNKFSANIQQYISGSFARNNLVTNFCSKTQSVVDSRQRSEWPKGSYCIMKHGNCPTGFRSGYVYWDDNDALNHNAFGGVLPDGHYDKNTKIYYCCRDDGPASRDIFLPRDRPFVLLRYRRTCQSVFGMHMRELFISWDDELLSNKDSTGGAHPFEDGGRHYNRLHYCHYTSKTSSVLQSIIG